MPDDGEFSSGERRRIDRLSRREYITESDARKIIRFAKTPRSKRDPSILLPNVDDKNINRAPSNIDGISEGECKQIRGRMSQADRPSEVIDDYPDKHASVIFRHAQGRCSHENTGDPTTSPRIDAAECKDMRETFASGKTVEGLLDVFHRSNNAVTKHVFGRCDHDLSDYERDRVTKGECDHMRTIYRANPNLTVPDISAAFLLSVGASHAHISGDCTHLRGVDPIDTQVDYRVTPDECSLMRRAHKAGKSCRDLSKAHAFDLNYQTVVKHVFGRCVHSDDDVDEDPAESDGSGRPVDPRDAVSKQDCAIMRRRYRTDVDVPSARIAERVGVGKGTLYYHVMGRCSHDDAREPPVRNKRSCG